MLFRRITGACPLILLCCLPGFGQAPRVVTSIDELIRVALDTNRSYLAAKERLAEAQALMRQAGLRPGPTVEVETATGTLTGSAGESAYSAAYFHTFETAHKRDKRVAIAQLGLSLVEAEIAEQRRLLVSEVRQRFITLAAEQLKLASVRALAPVAEEGYRLTVRRVELGDAAPLEQQLLLVESNRIQAQQAVLIAASEAATVELRTIVGLTSEAPLEITPDLDISPRGLTLPQLQERALRERPDLRVLQILEQQADAEGVLAQAEQRPDVTGSVRYARLNSRFDQFGFSNSGAIVPLRDADNILSFGVSIPLFTRHRAEPGIAVAQSRASQQRLRREYLERAIPHEVEAAYRRWSGAVRSLDILRNGVVAPSEKNLTIIREAYRLGQLRLFDVLNEQRRLVDLQLSVVNAHADAARALVELERAVGGPLP